MAARIREAAAAGVGEVELWSTVALDVDALAAALSDTGTTLRTMTIDPMVPLTDRSRRAELDAALVDSLGRATRLGAKSLVVQPGPAGPDPEADRRAVVEALRACADRAHAAGVTLLLENLNSRLDHPGEAIDTAAAALDVIEEVGSPDVRVLLDLYHALMMEEDLGRVLAGRGHLVGHVQLADVPGRGEPGSGKVDWVNVLDALSASGYDGSIGLECRPSTSTNEVLRQVRCLMTAAPGRCDSGGQKP